MASPSFKEELEKARDNPKSIIREAGKLIQRLIANDIHMYDGRENTLEPWKAQDGDVIHHSH